MAEDETDGAHYPEEVAVKILARNRKAFKESLDNHDKACNREYAVYKLDIDHPNLVRMLGMCLVEKVRPCLVMEVCLMDLSRYLRLKANGSEAKNTEEEKEMARNRSEDERREILRQISQGLVVLKENRILHRDLKPQNVLIRYLVHVCMMGNFLFKFTLAISSLDPPVLAITDFGLARPVSKRCESDPWGSALTTYTFGVGTPEYWSPEQKFNNAPHGFGIDVWALGTIGYRVWKGKRLELSKLKSEADYKDTLKTGLVGGVQDGPILAFLRRCLVFVPEGRIFAEHLLGKCI